MYLAGSRMLWWLSHHTQGGPLPEAVFDLSAAAARARIIPLRGDLGPEGKGTDRIADLGLVIAPVQPAVDRLEELLGYVAH